MLSTLEANMLAHDKAACLEQLEKATDAELWDVFLEGQSKIFFDAEFMWMAKGPWWQKAESILEIGSGNGAYLNKLSHQFQDKTFKGIDKLPQPVKYANERYARSNLVFQEGDAEVLDNQLINSADIVLFRLTLQHLKDPVSALKNTAHYLTPNGYVLIIDSFDRAKKTSHSIPTIDEALQLVAEVQKKAGTGNRRVTLELLQTLEDQQSPFSDLYEVVSTNIDTRVNVNGWTSPGTHLLVLKKKSAK